MYCLVKVFGRTKPIAKFGFSQNVIKRHFRNKSNERSNLIEASVVGSGSLGDPASLAVRTCDNFVHLFNCGEGTFRLMYARGYRFRFISNVFCTSNRWDRIGGVPSLARAVFDRTAMFPTFHGPPQIQRCLNRFAELTDLNPEIAVSERSYNPDPSLDDYHMQVDNVQLKSSNPSNTEDITVVAYFCRLVPRKGAVIVSRLTQNNIPFEYIQSINDGKEVTLDDGTLIRANDYRAPGFAGGNFLIIDVPSRDYLADLERNELLNGHIEEINSGIGMEFVAHFESPDIIDTPEYQNFMRRTNAKKHLALNENNMYCGLKHIHAMQHTLNQLDADIHPYLCSKFLQKPQVFTNLETDSENSDANISSANNPPCIEPTSTGTRYIFTTNGRISEKQLGSTTVEDDDESDSSSEDCESDRETEKCTTTTRANAFPKVVFFGTGSSFPGVTKSATSISVQTSPDSSIMLDCGEGTAGQICRFYGSRTEDVIRSIKALHITHMHGDHHMGIMDLIRMRQKYMPDDRPKLLLMAPKQPFESLLNFYEEHFRNVRDEFIMFDNEDLMNGVPEDFKSIINVNDLQTCRVPHTDLSYAISLKLKVLPAQDEEFKLTFSGDTIPCESLIELGRNSTLLIHEATLEDSLSNSAAKKMHSTISQAIEQGIKMQAINTILTHLSQRYRVLPPINDDLMKDKNVGIAFDHMEIVPDNLSRINDLYFKLKETYADELLRMEKRSLGYARRNYLSMIE